MIAADPARVERYVRASLAASFVANVGAAYVFAHPSSVVGALLGLPASIDPVYSGLCATFVALFGCAYGWLAMQPTLDRPLLWMGVVGKAGFFVLVASLWMRAAANDALVLAASGDMAFAAFWFWWLVRARHAASGGDRG
jgi:hypothetical protein